jgi:hypothetical protein
MLGIFSMIQYALYQDIYADDRGCPVPEVRCGKYSSNPCDVYPPVNGLLRTK